MDDVGKIILGPSTEAIGSVKITDGTETATVNNEDFLETSPEHSLKGKAMRYGTATATAAHATLLTVTAGKTFYLLSATLSVYSTNNDSYAIMYLESSEKRILAINTNITATYKTGFTDHAELAFPHPIPLAAGQRVRIFSAGGATVANGTCIGWEE